MKESLVDKMKPLQIQDNLIREINYKNDEMYLFICRLEEVVEEFKKKYFSGTTI